MAIPGWTYYRYEYSGRATDTGRQVPSSRVAYVVHHGSPAIADVRDRLNPKQVFVYIPYGTTGE